MNPHPAVSTGPGAAGPRRPRAWGSGAPELGWPVGVVAERLGIAAPTLRSWDRRHGIGPSLRTSGNHRRYTELDIRRVELMSRLTAQGVPAQSAADSVLAMGDADAGGAAGAAGRRAGRVTEPCEHASPPGALTPPTSSRLSSAPRVPSTPRTLSLLLRRSFVVGTPAEAWVEVFAPALRRVGDLWQEGRVGRAGRAPDERAAPVRAPRGRAGPTGSGSPACRSCWPAPTTSCTTCPCSPSRPSSRATAWPASSSDPACRRTPSSRRCVSPGRGRSSSGPRCRAHGTNRSGASSRSSTGRSRSSSAGPAGPTGSRRPRGRWS